MQLVEIGQQVQFSPLEEIRGLGAEDHRGNYITGTVVMIHASHRWFSVEYEFHGVKQRTSFKFDQIGKDVLI